MPKKVKPLPKRLVKKMSDKECTAITSYAESGIVVFRGRFEIQKINQEIDVEHNNVRYIYLHTDPEEIAEEKTTRRHVAKKGDTCTLEYRAEGAFLHQESESELFLDNGDSSLLAILRPKYETEEPCYVSHRFERNSEKNFWNELTHKYYYLYKENNSLYLVFSDSD